MSVFASNSSSRAHSDKAYLIILDGYGMGKHGKGDALFHAKTPYFDALFQANPHVLLKTDGECVGLPSFQTGGSEVGHITIGAGRAVKHLLTKINDQIDSGEFFENKKLVQLFTLSKERKSRIHFTGMLSDGGIHSFQAHLYGLLKMAKKFEIQEVYLHLFSDGRDVAERSFLDYFSELQSKISELGLEKNVKIATVSGRYFAMDRDMNWDRISEISDLMLEKEGVISSPTGDSVENHVKRFYTENSESDYYLTPEIFEKNGKIGKEDIVINFNYRSDRSRQISEKISDQIGKDHYGIFGPYCEGALEIFRFGVSKIENTLGEILSKNNKTQVRISETEKFNHVTFFFSGEQKSEFSGETRILVPSPKCKSYAEKPEMSAREQTEELIKSLEISEKLEIGLPDFIVQNYANADLVGHSGDFEAAKISAEVLDQCLSKIIPFAHKKGYQIFVTADHGNADEMFLDNGEPNAGHTKNLVPFIKVETLNGAPLQKNAEISQKILREKGTLQDIAPTILSQMKLPIPQEMTGENVFL